MAAAAVLALCVLQQQYCFVKGIAIQGLQKASQDYKTICNMDTQGGK